MVIMIYKIYRSVVYINKGEYDEAIKNYNKAIEIKLHLTETYSYSYIDEAYNNKRGV